MHDSGVEKADLYVNYLFCTLYETPEIGSLVNNINLNIIITHTCALTFHSKAIHCTQQVLHKLLEHQNRSADWILYCYLDITTGSLLHEMERFFAEVDALDELTTVLTIKEQSDLLLRLSLARKKYTQLKSSIWTKTELLSALISKERMFLKKHTRLYLRDVLDAVHFVCTKIDVYHEVLSSVHSTYLGKISNESADVANQTNIILKRLAAVGTVMLPFTVITAIMGMNVPIPYSYNVPASGNNPAALISVNAIFLITGIIAFLIFRRIRWL